MEGRADLVLECHRDQLISRVRSAAKDASNFVAVVAPHIEDLAASERNRGDASDDDECHHYRVLNRRRPVFTA